MRETHQPPRCATYGDGDMMVMVVVVLMMTIR